MYQLFFFDTLFMRYCTDIICVWVHFYRSSSGSEFLNLCSQRFTDIRQTSTITIKLVAPITFNDYAQTEYLNRLSMDSFFRLKIPEKYEFRFDLNGIHIFLEFLGGSFLVNN